MAVSRLYRLNILGAFGQAQRWKRHLSSRAETLAMRLSPDSNRRARASADQKFGRAVRSMRDRLVITMKPPVLPTERLVLRRWTDADRGPLAKITGDSEVMRYRLTTLTRQETDALIDSTETCFDQRGFGLWAVERTADGRLIGYIGLEEAGADMPFRPLVHIGWHLAIDTWGHGYATEGAAAVLDYGFDNLGLPEVIAHTTNRNERSKAVMRRLGMTHDPRDDFDAPWYPPGHPNRRFVLHRLDEANWRGRQADT